MNALELALLNDYQRGFPVCPRPFETIARRLGEGEDRIIEVLSRLRSEGKVSRVGAVFRPRTVGASTLAAMAVPESRLAQVAALVSARPEVNHNYARLHEWNLWFVVTAPDPGRLGRVLDDIGTQCGCPLIRLPLVEDYHIDLGFDLSDGRALRLPARPPVRPVERTPANAALVAALEPGLALVARPYAELGARARAGETEVLATLGHWVRSGVISRLGVIVRHHELGFTANAMTVWDVPDEAAGDLGRRLAAADCVTLCYRRARDLPHWRYNLYCMIHGRSRERVLAQIETLRESCGLREYPSAALFSSRRFKQRGARYALQPEFAHG